MKDSLKTDKFNLSINLIDNIPYHVDFLFKELIVYLFADAVSSMETKIIENSVLICPILPQYKDIPLHVSFLNRSLQCSGIETACDKQSIVIRYKCSDERGNLYEYMKMLSR